MFGSMLASDDEAQSLFGSPTPSRSPSPTLALPGTRDGVLPCIAQNVGTIALPGSQLCSKLSKDPLVYSTPRDATVAPSPLLSGTSTPSSQSRASSVVPSATKPRKRKRPQKEAQPSPSPSITLPDPSTPLPPNFLRNHMALLGTAGLVAGIKPANLSIQSSPSRGSTPTNPIVVDHDGHSVKRGNSTTRPVKARSKVSSTVRYDEHDAPRLGKRYGSMTPSLDIDPALLPAPTNKEIVAMLIGQKDIFPVLQNIFRVIAGQKAKQIAVAAAKALPASTPSSRRRKTKPSDPQTLSATTITPTSTSVASKAPPLKRRKLSRVPAGAADWDVPYPFQEGEGPEEYRKTWEKERGKQLISQLINLIRAAARKAATKKYLLQQETRRSAQTKSGHIVQSPRSRSAPASSRQLEAAKQLVSMSTPRPAPATPEASTSPDISSQSIAATPLEALPETSLDQLISSLLAASAPMGMSLVQCDGVHGARPCTLPDPSTAFVNTESGEDVNDDLINSWMNVFETFPIPSDGFVSALDTLFLQGEQSSSSSSTPASGPSNFDFFDMTSLDFDIHATHLQGNNTIELHKINKFSSTPVEGTNGGPSPSAPSPMPSVSSVGDVDPSTPASAMWEPGIPDIENPSNSQAEEHRRHEDDEVLEMRRFAAQEKEKWKERVEEGGDGGQCADTNVGLEREEPGSTPPTSTNTPSHALMGVAPIPSHGPVGAPSSPDRPPSWSFARSSRKKLNKQEIIRLAQERRKQLAEELDRIKVQLWETTIEQSVLVGLQNVLPQ